MDIREWIYNIYGGKTDIVNYKPYLYGSKIETMKIDDFITFFFKEVKDCQDFLKAFPCIPMTAEEMTKKIIKEHIIVF